MQNKIVVQMKHVISLLFTGMFLLLVACNLTAEKEELLNKRLTNYVDAYNSNNLLQLVGATHASAVKFYQSKDDSVFVHHFQQDSTNFERTYYENPLLRETKSFSKSIQRKYWVEKYTEAKQLTDEYCIFALSENNGESWFFLNEDDYFNTEINGFKRLFSK